MYHSGQPRQEVLYRTDDSTLKGIVMQGSDKEEMITSQQDNVNDKVAVVPLGTELETYISETGGY